MNKEFGEDIYELLTGDDRYIAVCCKSLSGIINDKTLPKALSSIPGASSLIQKIKEDKVFMERLEQEERFSLEEYYKYVSPLLRHISAHILPTDYDDKEHIVPWIIDYFEIIQERYPKAEDWYKIREDIEFYLAWQKREESKETPDPASECPFFETPYFFTICDEQRQLREIKKATSKEFGRVREQQMREPFVVIYEGEEGKIIVPQTKGAAQYWGQNTRWCISAMKDENNAFDEYNEECPIFIYLTTPTDAEKSSFKDYRSFKFSFTGGNIYDEKDEVIGDLNPKEEDMPSMMLRLHKAAMNTLKGGRLDYYKSMTMDFLYHWESEMVKFHRFKRLSGKILTTDKAESAAMPDITPD